MPLRFWKISCSLAATALRDCSVSEKLKTTSFLKFSFHFLRRISFFNGQIKRSMKVTIKSKFEVWTRWRWKWTIYLRKFFQNFSWHKMNFFRLDWSCCLEMDSKWWKLWNMSHGIWSLLVSNNFFVCSYKLFLSKYFFLPVQTALLLVMIVH